MKDDMYGEVDQNNMTLCFAKDIILVCWACHKNWKHNCSNLTDWWWKD